MMHNSSSVPCAGHIVFDLCLTEIGLTPEGNTCSENPVSPDLLRSTLFEVKHHTSDGVAVHINVHINVTVQRSFFQHYVTTLSEFSLWPQSSCST